MNDSFHESRKHNKARVKNIRASSVQPGCMKVVSAIGQCYVSRRLSVFYFFPSIRKNGGDVFFLFSKRLHFSKLLSGEGFKGGSW